MIGFGPGVTLDMLPAAQFTYAGRARRRSLARRAAARIDAIRKGDLVDRGRRRRHGEGLEDAEVRVEQRRHAFPFGSALQAARLTAGPAPEGQPDDNAAYRHVVETLFNAGSLENDTKWPPWEGDWGAGVQPAADPGRARLDARPRHADPRPRARCGPAGTTCRRACSACAGRPTRRR